MSMPDDSSTKFLYSIARREAGYRNFSTIGHTLDTQQFVQRLQQDGLDTRTAVRWRDELAVSARAALARVEQDAAVEHALELEDAEADTSEATSPAGWRGPHIVEPFGAHPYCARGELVVHHSAGPRGESYAVVCTAVHAASAAH